MREIMGHEGDHNGVQQRKRKSAIAGGGAEGGGGGPDRAPTAKLPKLACAGTVKVSQERVCRQEW